MNRQDFEAELRREGYGEVVDRRMEPGVFNPEHHHDFEARLLVLEGEMTIARNGGEEIFRAGDSFAMPLGCVHSERAGAAGTRYLAGRRYPARPAAE
jgi:quercetin dioxygenase-like cupin family protein